MGIFDKIKEPIFLKETSNAEEQLKELKSLEPMLNEEGKAILKHDIQLLEYGIAGEKQLAFELKNSHMPICVLHDVYLEDGELSAQIDYMVFTRKMCFVLECKNLYGNIEINNVGDFVRNIQVNGKWKKEGIYSPITQNQRHIELIKKLVLDSKKNLLSKFIANISLDECYKSLVVLANPKTVLNAKYAKKEVKGQVIRADQLVQCIKDIYNKSEMSVGSENSMLDLAQFFLDLHKDVQKSYTAKYDKFIEQNALGKMSDVESVDEKNEPINVVGEKSEMPIEESPLFMELKKYRWEKSKQENIKPYYIYNDAQLREVIRVMPQKKDDLMKISGFGDVKAGKYGDDIIAIIKKYL